jgi:hypothetical protein
MGSILTPSFGNRKTNNSKTENILIYKETPTGKSSADPCWQLLLENPNIGNVLLGPGWEYGPVLSGIWFG